MARSNKPQKLFHKYQKIYALISIVYNAILLGLIIFSFIKNDDKFNLLHIVVGVNGVYCLFDLITSIIFIVSKPFDQDLSKSTLIASISDTLFHNGLATVSFVLVAIYRSSKQKTVFWQFAFWITLIVFLRSLIMLASEVYWWIMLKNTLKDHTEEDFIIPEEELNTQYHQIAYDYHNPKRLFNQSNVVILNKKQKKKLNELQQEEKDLQQLEEDEDANTSNSKLDREKQNKNRIDQYIKERMANDNESNEQYLRQHQQYQAYHGSLSSAIQLIKNKVYDSDSSDSDSDIPNQSINKGKLIKNKVYDSDTSDSDIPIQSINKGQTSGFGNSIPESTVVEMYSPPNGNYSKRMTVSSSSSSSSSSSPIHYQQSYNSRFKKNSNTDTMNNNTVLIDMKNNSLGGIGHHQPTYSVQPLQNSNTNLGIDSAAPLSTQKTKVLTYLDQLIQENKEKKQAKRKEKQDHPDKYNRNHPQEWFSQVMGVKEIQEERDAKVFVRVKQKREKEIIEQKMEKLKEELNYADTPEQVEAIFNELKALNGIW